MSGTNGLLSPTSITNAIPRPKSPRRPDYRVGDHRGGPGFLAAESFQRTYDGSAAPKVRRRAHEEMGHFGVGELSGADPNATAPRMCAPILATDLLTSDLLTFNKRASACMNKSMEQSIDYAQKYGPTAKKNFAGCVNTTSKASAVAKEGLADFAVTAAEAYRQECKSDNRGDDAMFFMETSQQEDINSMMDNVSADEHRDTNIDSPRRRRPKSKVSPFPTPRSKRFPDEISIMKDPAADTDLSPPPRVDRMSSTKNFEPEKFSQKQGEDAGHLREARIEMFRTGRLDNLSDPEARLARTLDDLTRQDNVVDGLKRQLQMMQQNLDETTDELTKSRAVAQDQKFKATEIRARAVQDRKRLEDMYEEEAQMNKKLQSSLSELKSEVSALRLSLRSDRRGNDKTRAISSPAKPSEQDSVFSPQMISLRAEIVDLRSQLAEAHAANIEDSSSLNASGELKELKRRMKASEDIHRLAENLLKEKIEQIESTSKETKSKLEENLKASVTSENELRSKLIKTQANLQRLERERSRHRLHSSADVEKLSKQLASAREEITKLKQDRLADQKTAAENMAKLKKELEDAKKELVKANGAVLSKDAASLRDHRFKLTKDAGATRETKELQSQLKFKNDLLEAQAKNIDVLEEKLKDSGSKHVDPTPSRRELELLEGEIKLRKANESSLRAELKLQKQIFDEAMAGAAKSESYAKMRTLDESNVDHVRRKLDQFINPQVENAYLADEKKCSSEPEALKAGVRLKAVEQSYLNQICTLKARLSESKANCNEEKLRAEEERRISRENQAKRAEEIRLLRQEKEETLESKAANLDGELPDLRKQVVASVSTDASVASLKSFKTESSEVPDNVKRLRNELALARARLSAAKDQSRSLDERSRLIGSLCRLESNDEESLPTTPGSPDKSVDSDESTWAPPSLKNNSEAQTPSPLAGDADEVSGRESSWAPRPRSVATATNLRKKSTVNDLKRQLEESTKRLNQANSRLNGLVGTSNDAAIRDVSAKREIEITDEIMTSHSGNHIEVQQHRFADV